MTKILPKISAHKHFEFLPVFIFIKEQEFPFGWLFSTNLYHVFIHTQGIVYIYPTTMCLKINEKPTLILRGTAIYMGHYKSLPLCIKKITLTSTLRQLSFFFFKIFIFCQIFALFGDIFLKICSACN